MTLSCDRVESLDLPVLDALQSTQEIQPDLTNRATPLVSHPRLRGHTLLCDHAEAEANQHGGGQDEGDEEEDNLSPVGAQSHRYHKTHIGSRAILEPGATVAQVS